MYKLKLRDQTTINVIVICVFLFFFTLYFSFSLLWAQAGSFEDYGIIFETDSKRVIGDMTNFDANHYRTNVHPLFVLLVNPTGILLSHILKSQLLAGIFLNSFFGALGVLLAFFYLKSMTENIYDASLLACLFGVTTSQFFLSVIPETASLAICSLLVTYMVFLSAVKYKRDNFLLWIFAGIFTLAITTTNFVQTFICFTVFSFMRSNLRKRPLYVLARVFAFFLCVIACSAFFSKIQKAIYPSSSLFFLAESYQEDTLYTSPLIFRSPLIIISQLLKHSFLVNIIAPFPNIYFIGQSKPALTFSHSLDFTPVGWCAAFLWLTSLFTNAIQTLLKKQEIPLLVGFTFSICLLFNFVLHSVYGLGSNGEFEYFLYTGNFSFLVMNGLAYFPLQTKNTFLPAYRVFLALLTLLAGINNITILTRIVDIYK
jgi:hypothetical protein